ncbi:hypothetical protein KAR91_07125 [Candidatus Pacearchaeota archaeon]|nr:hypothetical protein [Candidatus Pacearchaeota archaeon]
MPEIEIKQETLDFLQNLVTEINGQDNRATATPYYYVIQVEKLVEDCTNGEDYYFDDDCNHLGTRDEAIKELMENHEHTEEDAEHYLDNECREISMSYQEVLLDGPGFLTEKACREHIRLNKHHYGGTARTYIDHFWRNPEMEQLFKAIEDVSGVNLDWH